MSCTRDYRYQPLRDSRQIRLLTFYRRPELEAGTESELPYVFELTPTRIEDAPTYETLSYAWGDAHKQRRILVKSSAQPWQVDSLIITGSLYEALPCLISHCKTGYLWIDQICINQKDILERNAQVSSMRDIYRCGAMVIVWLGPPKDQTPLLRDLIGFMSPDPKTYKIIPEHERDWMWDIDADKIIMLHRLIKKTIEDLQPDLILEPRFAHKWLSLDDLAGATEGKDIVDAVSILATNVKNELSDLIRRPWFTRIWIFQEVILSPQAMFLIGDINFSDYQLQHILQITAEVFEDNPALQCVDFDYAWGSSGWRTLLCVQEIIRKKVLSGLSLYKTLKIFDSSSTRGWLKASDARDFIYGILGICNEISTAQFDIDYSWSAEEVFAYATQFVMYQRQDLHILTLCGGFAEHSEKVAGTELELPSLVPDFTRNQDTQVEDRTVFSTARFPACSYTHRAQPPVVGAKELVVRGKIIGRVGACFSMDCYDQSWVGYATALFGLDHRSSVPCPHSDYERSEPLISELHIHLRMLKTALEWGAYRQSVVGGKRVSPDFHFDLYVEHIREGCPESQQLRKLTEGEKFEPLAFWEEEKSGDYKCKHGQDVFESRDGVTTCSCDCEWSKVRAWAWGTNKLTMKPKTILLSTDDQIILSRGEGEVGDEICILHGCRWPVLLRKTHTGQYQYVGGCFIEGGIDEESGRVTWREEDADEFMLV